MKRTHDTTTIEALESRIAPAGLITITPDGKTATWTDADGDKVTLKVSKGTLTQGLFTTDQTPATGLLVEELDLTNVIFKGTNISLSAVRDPLTGGDNAVNIGYVDATGLPLGTVAINGDLGRIDAGDPVINAKTPKAIGALTVNSMGMLGGELLPAGVTQTSEIVGKVGAVKIRGSVQGILFNVSGGAAGSIDSLSIGGSLIGTDEADSGRFSTSGKIGPITIKGSILGGTGQHSGSIEAGGAIASVNLTGSLLGGRSDTPSTDGTGVIRSDQTIGAVTIGGSIHGGTEQDSGLVSSAGNMGAVKVLGGIIGGSGGTTSGGILVGGNLASLSVRGDVLGGAALDSGIVRVDGKSGAITLSGSLTGGSGAGSGRIELGVDALDTATNVTVARDVTGGSGAESGSIHVVGKMSALKIGGGLRGASGADSGAVTIDNGAASVTVVGDIVGSTGLDSGSVRATGAIGTVTLSGNLLGGTADGSGTIVSNAKVEKMTITGSVLGGDLASTATADLLDSGLIQAGRIGALTIGGAIIVGENFNATYDLVNNAAIRVQNDIGALTITGGIQGTAETNAIITARGQATLLQDQTTDVAFGKITIGTEVRNASILAGYNTNRDVTTADANPNAQVGDVAINGDWIASDLVAGARWNDNFGDGTDSKSLGGADNPNIIATIAKIRVAGQILGTAGNATDRFAFLAEKIGEMKFGPTSALVALNAEKSDDNDPTSLRYNLAGTLDVRLFEFTA